MENNNRVTVKIYGQEYTIAGGSSERMLVVAEHVDSVMKALARGLSSMPTSSLAVLTAVNVADDLYESKAKNSELEEAIAEIRKENEKYIQLWEEAKVSFRQYKQDARNSVERRQELERIFNIKNVELMKANETVEMLKKQLEEAAARLQEADVKLQNAAVQIESEKEKNADSEKTAGDLDFMKRRNESLSEEVSKLNEKIRLLEEEKEYMEIENIELDEKYRELENNFYDIQVENLNLKNELDNLKKSR